MKYPAKQFFLNLAIAAVTLFSSCKKDASLTTADTVAIQAAVAQTQAIALSVSTTIVGDSVYAINSCNSNSKRDSISFSSLPTAVTGYLSATYSGYTSQKAFSIKDASGTLQGYVAVIKLNGNPVAVKFDASGNFVQVLEQREGHDLLGRGFHDGGHFENRDGKHRDTIALSALPLNITSYFLSHYVSDTLVRAAKTRDSGYVVLSKNNGLFATVFNSSGVFVSRITLPAPHGKENTIDQSALPAKVLSYLTTTYPAYVFDKAFQITVNGVVQGYCVVIEANSTKYAIQFDAAGNFVNVKIIR